MTNMYQEMAEEIKREYGALVTIKDISEYTGRSRDLIETCIKIHGLAHATRKTYWYKDVARMLTSG